MGKPVNSVAHEIVKFKIKVGGLAYQTQDSGTMVGKSINPEAHGILGLKIKVGKDAHRNTKTKNIVGKKTAELLYVP